MADVPLGVKIIAVLYWIGAAFMALGGVMLLLGASALGAVMSTALGALGAGVMVGIAVLILGLVVLNIFVGVGLWRAQPWARVVAIILSAIGLVMGLISLVSGNYGGVMNLVINGAIGGYLLFSKDVKDAF